jgi:hypothetical protein
MYRKLFAVQMPQALDEDLVVAWHSRSRHKRLRRHRSVGSFIEIEQDVVEERKLVVQGHGSVANVLVQLSQRSIGLGRVGFCYKDLSENFD